MFVILVFTLATSEIVLKEKKLLDVKSPSWAWEVYFGSHL